MDELVDVWQEFEDSMVYRIFEKRPIQWAADYCMFDLGPAELAVYKQGFYRARSWIVSKPGFDVKGAIYANPAAPTV